jgi:hypothetical protein
MTGDAPRSEWTIARLAPMPRWIAWQAEPEPGKAPRKTPYDPRGGKAKADDPSTWGTRPQAEARARRLPQPLGIGGVGLELGICGKGLAIGGVDLDTCLDGGEFTPWALAVLERLDSYAEISPSGTGAKVFFRYDPNDLGPLRAAMGKHPGEGSGKKWAVAGHGEHPPAIELFLDRRYFAVTGRRLEEHPDELRLVSRETLEWIIREAGPALAGVRGNGDAPRAGAPRGHGHDNTRSAAAMRIGARVRRAGGTFDEMCQAIAADPVTRGWYDEKGTAHGGRELQRIWKNVGEGQNGHSHPAARSAIAAPAGSPEGWDEPLDLFAYRYLETTPRFDVDLFPPPIAGLAKDVGARFGVTPESIAMLAVAAAAGAIDDAWKIQASHDDKFLQRACLWLGYIAESGQHKSPILEAAISPHRIIAAEWADENEKRRAEWKLEHAAWKVRFDAWRKAEAKNPTGASPPKQPDEPTDRRNLVNSATVESMIDLMAANPRGLLRTFDELSGFFAEFDAYRDGKMSIDRPFWMSAWNGGPGWHDRVKRGATFVRNLSCGIVGMIPPTAMKQVAEKMKGAEDGLLQRFLVVRATEIGEPEDRPANGVALSEYRDAVVRLYKREPPEGFHCYVMDSEAHRYRQMLNAAVRALAACPGVGDDAALAAWLRKVEGNFARVLLVFHMIEAAGMGEHADPEIHWRTAARVVRLFKEYLIPHACWFFRSIIGSRPADDLVNWIAGYVLTRPGLAQITVRDIYRAKNRTTEMSGEIEVAMRALASFGWVVPADGEEPARPSRWAINPLIHARFAATAAQEMQRRAEVSERMTAAHQLLFRDGRPASFDELCREFGLGGDAAQFLGGTFHDA